MAVLVILLVVSVRLRLLSTPLERDEGEYAYAGQLMLEGIPPYRLAFNMKLPGTYAAYALIMALFGQSIAGIHFGFLLVNAGAVALVYLLSKRLFGTASGIAASAAYALLSVGSSVLGTSAHATHFVILPALAGILLLLEWTDSHRMPALFWSGLLCGLAFVMKQPGGIFAAFGALYLIWSYRGEYCSRWSVILRNLGLFVFAASLPFAITCLVLWRAGVFSRFWFWTFTYAREYGSIVPLSSAFEGLSGAAWNAMKPDWPIWLLSLAGLVLLWRSKESRAPATFATAFLVFSFGAVCPGLYFREHYFVLLLPAVALLAGASVAYGRKVLPNVLPVLVFAGVVLFSVVQQAHFLFSMSAVQVTRALYGAGPFPEAIPVAQYIRDHSTRNSRIAVIGSEPEIYFYARRHSATGYIYTYALMEPQPFAEQMQEEMIHDIEASKPEYAVFVNVGTSWLQREASPMRLFEWWSDYRDRHYELVGVADILGRDPTEYRWDTAAATYKPRSPAFVTVYKRRTS